MKHIFPWLILSTVLMTAIIDADESETNTPCKPFYRCPSDDCEGYSSEEDECDYPLRLPHERAWSYDEELESPTTWPGKREDSFYDWMTK